ncbi:MAG: VOC family protein [Alphaproteobacteria bacterium]|nr:VOC family protein [Alphaproteobacteria bacterium]MDE2111379.1 VOC family protein [Alphaproteobacteria bacterium]MDE2495568.1 VOC family protein [Alphaproteobacteria bacterium]
MPKLDHLSLAVKDCRRSRDWYAGGLGFKVEFEIPQGGHEGLGVVAIQDAAGFTVFLEQTSKPILSGQSSYTIQVDDVDKLWERLSQAGIAFISKPGKQFWGYGAVLADPDGHLLHLYDEASMKQKG